MILILILIIIIIIVLVALETVKYYYSSSQLLGFLVRQKLAVFGSALANYCTIRWPGNSLLCLRSRSLANLVAQACALCGPKRVCQRAGRRADRQTDRRRAKQKLRDKLKLDCTGAAAADATISHRALQSARLPARCSSPQRVQPESSSPGQSGDGGGSGGQRNLMRACACVCAPVRASVCIGREIAMLAPPTPRASSRRPHTSARRRLPASPPAWLLFPAKQTRVGCRCTHLRACGSQAAAARNPAGPRPIWPKRGGGLACLLARSACSSGLQPAAAQIVARPKHSHRRRDARAFSFAQLQPASEARYPLWIIVCRRHRRRCILVTQRPRASQDNSLPLHLSLSLFPLQLHPFLLLLVAIVSWLLLNLPRAGMRPTRFGNPALLVATRADRICAFLRSPTRPLAI